MINNRDFMPDRMASWWCSLDDLLWPEKKIVDRLKRRAERYAEARIATVINFGFHDRFDFSNYFGRLHAYYANVCEELHRNGIKFMDHYSCNLHSRPRGLEEIKKLHYENRHSVLLYPDPIAAAYAQYEGCRFQDLCEIDFRDGGRGYSWSYQTELFCHNNPKFLEMHQKYLKRLLAEVPLDALEVDDMCDYAGLTTCGCPYCRERFRRDYGREIPPLNDAGFWGDTSRDPWYWGNYENPAFREWLRMRSDSIADHLKLIKKTIGDLPLMTCCSSSGPIALNNVSLTLENLAPSLNLFMLENCGIAVDTVQWARMDAEALYQKDIAEKAGHAPTVALSYTIYQEGAYLGWSLSRFWGACSWCSTESARLVETPPDAPEEDEVIGTSYNWELKNSPLSVRDGRDAVDVRLAGSLHCRENGWRDEEGREHWDRVCAWSRLLLEHNVGYRFVRTGELGNADALLSDDTPIILDGVGCVSDSQFDALTRYLENGGTVWLGLPYGTHDEKGFLREEPLSGRILSLCYPGLRLIDCGNRGKWLGTLLASGAIMPRIRQLAGGAGWAARLRAHSGGAVLHLMNTDLEAIPHPEVLYCGAPVLLGIKSQSPSGMMEFELDFGDFASPWENAVLMSPELGDEQRAVSLERIGGRRVKMKADVTGIKLYGIVQGA